jgi:hypothetical protein
LKVKTVTHINLKEVIDKIIETFIKMVFQHLLENVTVIFPNDNVFNRFFFNKWTMRRVICFTLLLEDILHITFIYVRFTMIFFKIQIQTKLENMYRISMVICQENRSSQIPVFLKDFKSRTFSKGYILTNWLYWSRIRTLSDEFNN